MTKPSLLSKYPSPSRGLLFQCPLCKELTHLDAFTTLEEGLVVCCSACSGIFAYQASVHSLMALEAKAASASGAAKSSSLSEDLSSSRFSTNQDHSASSSSVQRGSLESLLAQSPIEKDLSDGDAATHGAVSPPPSTEKRTEPSMEGTRRCPKCHNRCREDLKGCPSCGLVFANIGVTFVPSSQQNAETLQEKGAFKLWNELLEDWDNEELHNRFLQYCVSHELFELLAARYREIKEEDPARAERAQSQLEKIVEHVQRHFLMFQPKDNAMTNKVGSWRLVLSLLLLGLGLLAFYIIWHQAFAPVSLP